MAKDRVPSPAEIDNDPSLKWVPYRKWEALWSDEEQDMVRFMGYDVAGRLHASRGGTIGNSVDVTLDPLRCRRNRPGAQVGSSEALKGQQAYHAAADEARALLRQQKQKGQ